VHRLLQCFLSFFEDFRRRPAVFKDVCGCSWLFIDLRRCSQVVRWVSSVLSQNIIWRRTIFQTIKNIFWTWYIAGAEFYFCLCFISSLLLVVSLLLLLISLFFVVRVVRLLFLLLFNCCVSPSMMCRYLLLFLLVSPVFIGLLRVLFSVFYRFVCLVYLLFCCVLLFWMSSKFDFYWLLLCGCLHRF